MVLGWSGNEGSSPTASLSQDILASCISIPYGNPISESHINIPYQHPLSAAHFSIPYQHPISTSHINILALPLSLLRAFGPYPSQDEDLQVLPLLLDKASMGQPGWSWGGLSPRWGPPAQPRLPAACPALPFPGPPAPSAAVSAARTGTSTTGGAARHRGGPQLVSTKVLSKPPATSHLHFPIFLFLASFPKETWTRGKVLCPSPAHAALQALHASPTRLHGAGAGCEGWGLAADPKDPREDQAAARAQHQLSHQRVLAGTPVPQAGCLQAAPFHIGDFFFPSV